MNFVVNVTLIKRLEKLEKENSQLKLMYEDLSIDNKILMEVIEKKL